MVIKQEKSRRKGKKGEGKRVGGKDKRRGRGSREFGIDTST